MEQGNILTIAVISFILGVIYITGHIGEVFNIMTNYVQTNNRSYLNINNFAYCFMGIAHLLFPVAILYPHKKPDDKKKMLKAVCYSIAVLYFVANFWIFGWLFSSLAQRNISFDVAQYQREASVMFNHLEWASRNAETIFYDYFASVLWFLIGYNVDRDRRFVCKLMVLEIAFVYIVPIVFYYLYNSKGVGTWWIKKSIPLFLSDAIMTFGLFYAARRREVWKAYICPLKASVRRHHHHHRHHHGNENKSSENN